MLTLGPTNTLSVVLSAPKTTTEPTFAASYFDGSSTGIVGEGVSQGQTSGTTPVVMLTSPASGNFRHISSLFFNNLDSAPVTMSLLLDTRVIFGPVLLQPGDCITGERGGGGPRVVSMNGSLRQVSSAAWGSLIGTLSSQTDLAAALAGKVATSLTVAGHALTGNVNISAADVGADASGAASTVQGNLTTHAGLTTTAHGGLVPSSRTVNGKALSADISLSASDVGADASGAAAAVTKSTLGLGNVDNTSDTNKPVSTAQSTAIGLKLNANDASVTNARAPTAHASTHVTGGSDVIANVIAAGNAGLMTGADKTKLDGIAAGATALALASTTPTASTYGGTATVGTDSGASHADHKHALAALPTATTSAAGIIQLGSTVAAETFGATAVAGSSGLASDRDHVHAMPAAPTASSVGLGSVTNDAQTKAAIVPNTAPAAGALLVGNAGATAYASTAMSGDVTITSAGVTAIKSSPTLTTPTISGLLTPATVAGIKGTAAADSAQAGSIGEVITSTVATGSSVSLTNVTSANVTSIALTAGDWDVWGCGCFTLASSTTMGYLSVGINSTSATLPANNAGVGTIPGAGTNAVIDVTVDPVVDVAPIRVNISAGATYYLVARAKFGTSTCKAYGTIYARRRR